MKRQHIFTAAALCLLLLTWLSGCSAQETDTQAADADALQVVATVYPVYDWARVLTDGTDISVSMLQKNGEDMHSYQPTVQDIASVCDCDLFVYVGGESDAWVADALDNCPDDGPAVLNLIELLGDDAQAEEPLAQEAEEETAQEKEYDEHVWLSLRNARKLVGEIADTLAALCPADAEAIRENEETYLQALAALDEQYTACTDGAAQKTLLFCDRYPFAYLARDYDLTCYAAFPGCSSETEASFATVTFLAEKVRVLSLPCVLVIDDSDGRLAQTVLQTADRTALAVLRLHSLQAVSDTEIAEGATYLSLMQDNLEVLREALQGM